jgi:hypothetical protein
MKWTKATLLLGSLALGWYLAQRTQPVLADGGEGGQPSSPANTGMVIAPEHNPDPKMVVTPKHNPDPKMVVTPPWPVGDEGRGEGVKREE